MNGLLGFLKDTYAVNKKVFVLMLLIIVAFVLIGCSNGGGATGNAVAPNSPYIGGGCG